MRRRPAILLLLSLGMASTPVLFAGCTADAAPALAAAPVALVRASPPDSAALDVEAYRRGRAVYMQRCQFCHGERADGQGALSGKLEGPPPRDFREPAIAEAPAEALRRTVTEGGEATGLSPAMPAWGDVLSPQQVADVVGFIRAVSRYGRVLTDADLEAAPVRTP